ncbi:cdkn1a interacting zinc finger protein 1a [Menidia menidia]
MFNPHIHHQQQQQQQQLHQHLRQLQQLFQQQPPPPPQPPPAHHVSHHHQTQRAIPVPPQTAPPPRMVNLCQATQTTILAPNPMLQGALLMQQMQGNMRGFGMGGQQFRQFFTAGTRSSLLGPVPMGMAIKSPIMGFPAARPFHPHARFFNATTPTTTASSSSSISTTDSLSRQSDRKRDNEQMAAGSTDDQPPAPACSINEVTDETQTDGAVGGVDGQISEEQLEEPKVKKQRREGSEKPKEQHAVEDNATPLAECNSNTEDIQPEGCSIQEDEVLSRGSEVVEALEETSSDQSYSCLSAQPPSGRLSEGDQQVSLTGEETSQVKDASLVSLDSQDEDEEGVAEGSNKFYCYLCSITCHNQQNFRSHMNSISHQQRMMEIQHMSNACLVSLLPRVQESLQGANKDTEKKADSKRWCATCRSHFTCNLTDHRRSVEHKLASRTDILSCAVCKKRFKTSQNFLEHLHSQEHRQKLQENGCEALAKLTAMDTDGFSLEEDEEGEEGEERRSNDGDQRGTQLQDGWSSLKEVTPSDMASDEQYDPDTVYGSSFLVPVAGFICRLCNKFYHFESSALHTHCKSQNHFENLKRYSTLAQKGDQSSGGAIQAAESFQSETEAPTDCSDDMEAAANVNSMQPVVTVSRMKTDNQLEENQQETDSTSQVSAANTEDLDKALSLHQGVEDGSPTVSPAELPAGSREEAGSEPAPAQDSNEEEEEPPAAPGKKNSTGKAKATAKRRSGRATNRR